MVDEVKISPADAEQDGCSASVSFSRSYEEKRPYSKYVYTFYSADATASGGWQFDYWEIKINDHTWHESAPPSDVTETKTSTANPSEIRLIEHTLYHYADYDPYSISTEDLIELTAHFKRPPQPQTANVSVSVRPVNAGYASGGGKYDIGASCTINAEERCSPWTFDHWEFSDGRTFSTKSVTFRVSGDISCVACFRHPPGTGKILCDASSSVILRSAGGKILHDGNLVNA